MKHAIQPFVILYSLWPVAEKAERRKFWDSQDQAEEFAKHIKKYGAFWL